MRDASLIQFTRPARIACGYSEIDRGERRLGRVSRQQLYRPMQQDLQGQNLPLFQKVIFQHVIRNVLDGGPRSNRQRRGHCGGV